MLQFERAIGTVRQLQGNQAAALSLGGAMLGWGLAHVLGFDLFATGYGAGSIAAIVMVGLGGGLGLQMARRWQIGRAHV